jgi:hypothetical protein
MLNFTACSVQSKSPSYSSPYDPLGGVREEDINYILDVNTLKELANSGGYKFYKIEHPEEVDHFSINYKGDAAPEETFSFFRGLGIVDYPKFFKSWLREFPRPLFIVCVRERYVVGWVYISNWHDISKTGDTVWVLRAIEIQRKHRNKKIGLRLIMLGLSMTMGYLLTKPLDEKALAFFKSLGFMAEDEFKISPIDLSIHAGYVILPPYKRMELLDNYNLYFSG